MINTLVVSGIALLSAAVGWLLSHRWQARSYRLAVTNNRMQWNQGVESWAQRVVETIVRLHTCFDRMDYEDAIKNSDELAITLSVLVEQGRLYFPNVMRDEYGQHKSMAKRGCRSAVLDPLVAAVKLAQGAELRVSPKAIEDRFGKNQHSKALQLYLNAFLSMIDYVLLIEASHKNLIARLIEANELDSAFKLRRLLCPEKGDPEPSGHRYWLNPENKDGVPDEDRMFRPSGS